MRCKLWKQKTPMLVVKSRPGQRNKFALMSPALAGPELIKPVPGGLNHLVCSLNRSMVRLEGLLSVLLPRTDVVSPCSTYVFIQSWFVDQIAISKNWPLARKRP